jgi:DNA adenine methylase
LQQISHQHHILLSNSDDGTDFFTNLYSDFFINKIAVARSINSKGKARGKISELVISNYNNFLQNLLV